MIIKEGIANPSPPQGKFAKNNCKVSQAKGQTLYGNIKHKIVSMAKTNSDN